MSQFLGKQDQGIVLDTSKITKPKLQRNRSKVCKSRPDFVSTGFVFRGIGPCDQSNVKWDSAGSMVTQRAGPVGEYNSGEVARTRARAKRVAKMSRKVAPQTFFGRKEGGFRTGGDITVQIRVGMVRCNGGLQSEVQLLQVQRQNMFFEIGRRKTGKVKKLPFLHLWCAGNEGRGMMRGDKGEEFRVMFLSRFCSASVVIRFVYIYIIQISIICSYPICFRGFQAWR